MKSFYRNRETAWFTVALIVLFALCGCSVQTAEPLTFYNYAQTNQIIFTGDVYLVAERDQLLSFSQAGALLDTAFLKLDGDAKIAELAMLHEDIILRDENGIVYRLASDKNSVEKLEHLRPVFSLLVLDGQLYYASKSVCNDLWCWNEGQPTRVLNDLMPGRQLSAPTDTYLYYLDADGIPFRYNVSEQAGEQVSDLCCDALISDVNDCYLLCDGKVIRLSDGKTLLSDTRNLWACEDGKLYYATSNAGVVVWDGVRSSVLVEQDCATVQICRNMMIYSTADAPRYWQYLLIQ